MPDAAAELLFQIIAGRAEQAAVIVTTNLPFSEWTTKIPNARLCKAMLDRLTDQAISSRPATNRTAFAEHWRGKEAQYEVQTSRLLNRSLPRIASLDEGRKRPSVLVLAPVALRPPSASTRTE
jgi:hypothetical protein